MTPESLSTMVAGFLEGSRAAVVVEDGVVVFDLADAKYSISGEYNKCLVHLWSNERNVVRRVLDAEIKGATLRLQVQRMGQSRPTRLDICRDRDQRSPAARRAARAGKKFSGLDGGPADYEHGPGTVVRAGLPARMDAAGAARAGDCRGERRGNADDGGWRAYLRHSLAGGLPSG